MSESSISENGRDVVWRMSPYVAAFYADELEAIAVRLNDSGVRDDARALRRHAESLG
jgi:hypothetical protein